MTAPSVPHTSGTMLITGATGFIGSRLATLALARGYIVKTLTRSEWTGAPAVPAEQRYLGSLPSQIPSASLRGVDIVVHCAAETEPAERRAHAINVEGTSHLAALAHGAGVQTFIFLSSQSARADAPAPYGRSKYAAEQQLLALDGLRVIILRPGLVFGSGVRGMFQRMVRTVDALPVIPAIGGGTALVQPIHVDDLCEAIFRSVERSAELDKTILLLGDPQGLPLAELLQNIALARTGRRKVLLPIPFEPVELAVAICERLHIPLPLNSTNLRALRFIERMDTAPDLERLGLRVRSLNQTNLNDSPPEELPIPLKERAVRVLLVGAGRIGIVHAVTLSRLKGAVLCGIVDQKPSASNLLRSTGLSAPAFTDFKEAVTRTRPDAVVIATPVASHFLLARASLSQGLAVLVEKPLAIRREQLGDYERLAKEFPGRSVQVGYVMPRAPQVAYYLDQLRTGQLGNVREFVGFSLLTLIQETAGDRWEVKKSISGGGVLINSGGHVLSMIRTAFGDPQSLEAETLKNYSDEVEDSAVVSFKYPEFSGKQCCSWSIGGFPRQENLLLVRTDRGQLMVNGTMGVFIRVDGELDIKHQLDFDGGFNLAPDYLGAGFANELTDLAESARNERPAPMSLAEAIPLERLIFRAYQRSREVKTFSGDAPAEPAGPGTLRLPPAPSAANPVTTSRVLDLRDLSLSSLRGAISDRGGNWNEYLVSSGQLKALPGGWDQSERLRVTVPDFMAQSRLLATGRYREVLSQMGVRGMLAAARSAVTLLPSERGPSFWLAATSLLAAGLQPVPRTFRGTLLLHGYLTDLALSVRRLDVLERMLKLCRKAHPHARVGFHTNMAAEALNALYLLDAAIDDVSVLTSPNGPHLAPLLRAMRKAGTTGTRRLTAEVGPAPAVVQRVAFDAPERWAHGVDAVLIGAAADPAMAERRRIEIGREWAKVFPGLDFPETIL